MYDFLLHREEDRYGKNAGWSLQKAREKARLTYVRIFEYFV